MPVTDGQLDLGPWQQVFYTEFDGRRAKRLIIKVSASRSLRVNQGQYRSHPVPMV